MRADVHSPTNLVTEDYEFVFCEVNHVEDAPGWVLRRGDWGLEMSRWIAGTDRLGRSTDQCHHCGARLNYFAVLRHLPTGDAVVVGETCLDNRFSLATSEFHRLRRECKLNRERIERERLCEETLESLRADGYEHAPRVLERDFDLGLIGYLTDWPREVTEDIRARFWRYGNVSRKQADLVERLVAEIPEKLEARARQNAERAAEIEVPAPTGRAVIEGEVIKVDWRETDFGPSLKLTIKSRSEDNEVWLGWVTCPRAIEDEVQRGDRVRLTATWEPAEEGGNFAFGKRPTKAVNLTKENGERHES